MKAVPWKIVSITGSSGSGKSTLFSALLSRFPDRFRSGTNVTTRLPRAGDEASFRYVSRGEFDALQMSGAFLWTKENHGNLYGTLRSEVDIALSSDVISLMIISPENIPQLVSAGHGKVLALHIDSPGDAILRNRLLARGDDVDSIVRRIRDCQKWDDFVGGLRIPVERLSNTDLPETLIAEAIRRIGV